MPGLRFWKRAKPVESPTKSIEPVRFGLTPRTDVGSAGLPEDPEQAARLFRLRQQREQIRHEVETAEAAADAENRWQTEIRLIDLAIAEIRIDLERLQRRPVAAGEPLPPIPIQDLTVDPGPPPRVSFRLGDEEFVYEEDLDWAERGFQIARSDLHMRSGSVQRVVSALSMPDKQPLIDHLTKSLFAFATDQRDRDLNGESLVTATLADMAPPDPQFGDWRDWNGNSPNAQELEAARAPLIAEIERLDKERKTLAEEEASLAESLPFARRRLVEIENRIAAIGA